MTKQVAAFPATHKDWQDKYRADFDAKMKEWHTQEQQAHLNNQPLPPRPEAARAGTANRPPRPTAAPNVPANLFNGMVSADPSLRDQGRHLVPGRIQTRDKRPNIAPSFRA